jgi:hypothetical protein
MVKLEEMVDGKYSPYAYEYTYDIKDIDFILITDYSFDIVPIAKL